MVSLSTNDVLELMRYQPAHRHPLEILGYEYSTRGRKLFRQECPDYFPQIVALIDASLAERGTFPPEPNEDVLREGTYLERKADGQVTLHTSVEVSISQTARVNIDFPSARAAIVELIKRLIDRAYLTVPDGEMNG